MASIHQWKHPINELQELLDKIGAELGISRSQEMYSIEESHVNSQFRARVLVRIHGMHMDAPWSDLYPNRKSARKAAAEEAVPLVRKELMRILREKTEAKLVEAEEEFLPLAGGDSEEEEEIPHPNLKSGEIHLWFGPMGAGKTDMLLREIRIHRHKKQKCILIKHSHDDVRGGRDQIKTKDGLTDSGYSASNLRDFRDRIENCDVIGVDEGQFFEDLVEECLYWARRGKLVLVAALDGDYQRNPFPQIAALIPHCEKVKKLRAICMTCSAKAAFTKRIRDCGNVQKVAGGFELYSPVCRRCYEI
jgi:thymidine kinase